MKTANGFAARWAELVSDAEARRRALLWALLLFFAGFFVWSLGVWVAGGPDTSRHEHSRQVALCAAETALCAALLARNRTVLRRVLMAATFALLVVNTLLRYVLH